MTQVHPAPSTMQRDEDDDDDGDDAYGTDRLAQRVANYETDENHTMLTRDHEDHTFSGIMFTVECLDRAIQNVVLRAVHVRGELGHMTVWVHRGRWHESGRVRESPEKWACVFDDAVEPSPRQVVPLALQTPVALEPGDLVSLYVHSAIQSDTGLVYDNARGGAACEDTYLRVGAGCAHLSPVPFAGYHPWGAWRNRRSFVGRLGYGVKHLLWQPEKDIHRAFPASFHSMVLTLLMARNRNDNYLADLPEDILFYILHMCHSKWAPPLPKPTMLTALADAKSTQLVKKKATSFVRSVRKSIAGLFRRKSTTAPAPAAD